MLNLSAHTPEKYFVQVTREIHTPRGSTIFSGDHVLVDPSKQPSDGDMVAIGESLVPWAAQQVIEGVAVRIHRTVG